MDRVQDELRNLFDEYLAEYEASLHVEETSNNSKNNVGTSVGSTSCTKKRKVDFMDEFYKFSEEEDITQSKSELDVYLEEKLHPSKKNE